MSDEPVQQEAQIYTSGQEYWTLMQRFNQNRDQPLTRRAVVKAMRELLSRTKEPALKNRITQFISRNQPQSPSNSPGGSGPMAA